MNPRCRNSDGLVFLPKITPPPHPPHRRRRRRWQWQLLLQEREGRHPGGAVRRRRGLLLFLVMIRGAAGALSVPSPGSSWGCDVAARGIGVHVGGGRRVTLVRGAEEARGALSHASCSWRGGKKRNRCVLAASGPNVVDTSRNGSNDERNGQKEEEEDPPPPLYQEAAQVRTVFADPYFYDDEAADAEHHRPKREAVFGENMTVEEVFDKYLASGEEKDGLARLVREIKATDLRLEAYFAPVPRRVVIPSLEARLAELGILAFDTVNEVAMFKERSLKEGMPSALAAFDAFRGCTRKDRQDELCFVMGSSGSGKTFFSFQHLRDFLNDEGLPSVTLYVSPGKLVRRDEFEKSLNPPEALATALKQELDVALSDLYSAAPPGLLQMHVCVVFDEVSSSPSLLRFFEDKDMVTALLGRIKRKSIAKSIVLVVSGTGLTATAFDSRKDAYVFRLRPWTRDDLLALLNHFKEKLDDDKYRLKLKPGETSVAALADAVGSLPLLEALTTNGRAAYYMVRALAVATRRTSGYKSRSWRSHLSFLVPTIVDEVVDEYMENNGLSRLRDDARPRVAAWVFGALARLKKLTPEVLTFEGLIDYEPEIALMLLDFNVEKLGNQLFLVEGELYAAGVTPALVIVLFNMVGVFAGVLSGWRGEEGVAFFYAAHQAIIELFNGHDRAIRDLQLKLGKGDPGYEDALKNLITTFDKSLEQLCVYRLQHPIQSNPRGGDITFPIVPRNSILLNADKASFADVMGPYMFLQTKHTSKDQALVRVNLASELRKCCLLKSCTADRALRGLVALWSGQFDGLSSSGSMLSEEEESSTGWTRREFLTLQASDAYPANLIMSRLAFDGVTYDKISSRGRLKNSHFHLPPLPETLGVRFVISTNARTVVLSLPGNFSLSLTAESLDDAMQVDASKLTVDEDRSRWLSFSGSVRDGVRLQFLFTTGEGATGVKPAGSKTRNRRGGTRSPRTPRPRRPL